MDLGQAEVRVCFRDLVWGHTKVLVFGCDLADLDVGPRNNRSRDGVIDMGTDSFGSYGHGARLARPLRSYNVAFQARDEALGVLKRAAGSELAAAVRAVHRGGLVLDPSLAREALLPTAPPSGAGEGEERYLSLTEREKQVLKLVAEGNSNKEVAQLLGISVKTAMSHRERVMQKLDIHNRTELVKFALKQGVIKL